MTQPFDQDACQLAKQLGTVVFTRHPEVRSIAVLFDYYGALNDANIQKGVWLSDHGPVDSPDGVFGSLFQTLRLLEEQMKRAVDMAVSLRKDVQAMSEKALELHEHERQKEAEPADKPGAAE